MGPSFRQTVAQIFSDERMKEEVMLSGHVLQMLDRSRSSSSEYLVVAQDTTYLNYDGHKQMDGIGRIQGEVRGLMLHSTMVFGEDGIPLGLLHQQYWTRKEGGRNLKAEEKESEKWNTGLEKVNEYLSQIDKKVVVVQDREADIFDFFKSERRENIELLVRVCQPRNLELSELKGVSFKLTESTLHLADFGLYTVKIKRGNKNVALTLSLKASKVNVYPGKHLSPDKHKIGGLSLVVAQPVKCVDEKGNEVKWEDDRVPIWYLLTTLSIDNQEDAIRVVSFYAQRWGIERFHYTIKSGALNVERLQFDDIDTLINSLAFYSVVAWQVMRLTLSVREQAQDSAEKMFDKKDIELLGRLTKKNIVTVKDAVLALGAIVSFVPTTKQPFPGIKVMSQALESFFFIKLGAQSHDP